MIIKLLRFAAIVIFTLGFLRGLAAFGATRTPDLYRLFLVTGVPTLLCALGLFGTSALRKRWMLCWLPLGLFLFARAGWSGAVEGRGYVLLALGWSAFFITSVVGGRSVRAARGFTFGLIAVGVFETLYGLAQAVAGFDYIGNYARNMGRVATGTLFNRNHYAGLLNLILPMTLGTLYAVRALPQYLAARQPARSRSESETLSGAWLAFLISAFMGLAVLLSQSRGGTATLVMCLILAAILLRARGRSGGRLASAAPWVLLILLLGLGAGVGIEALLTKFSTSEASLLDRGAIFLDTLRLIGEHPWLGVGPSMYAWSFRAYQSVSGQVWFDYAHNDYLQTAAEWGLPIAFLFWTWVCWRFYRSCTTFFAAREPWIAGMSLGCAVSIFSILLHSLVDFNLYIPTNLMVFGSVLGLSWSVRGLHSESRESRLKTGSPGLTWALPPLLAGVLIFSGWTAAKRLVALEIANANPDVDGLSRAIQWDPANPDFYWRRGRIARDQVEPASPDQVDADFRQALELNPHNWFYWQDLGFHDEVLGRLESAESAFREAARLSPSSADVRWNLANFLLRRRDRQEWLRELGAAVKRDLRYLEPAAALLLRLRVSPQEADAVWPADRLSRMALLRFLSRRQERSQDGPLASEEYLSRLWNEILEASPQPMELVDAEIYLNRLLERGRYDQARTVWDQLMRHNGFEDPSYSSKQNYVWDGAFEFPAFNRGLGWHIEATEKYRIARTSQAEENRGSLVTIEFDGNSNLAVRNLRQMVVVDPGAEYRFSFRARSEGLRGDQGVYFQITNLSTGTTVRTEEIRGSHPWKRYTATCRVPPGSRKVLIDLRRDKSRRLSGEIEGTIWVDDVRLEKK